MPEHRPFLLAVMGPTATGKTEFAETLAARHDAVLVNSDAFQVYRGLDIGTAKPPHKELYRLIDIKGPEENFGLGEWVRMAMAVLTEAFTANKNVVVVGGTGLYVRALFEGYTDMAAAPDPELRLELEQQEREQGLEALAKKLQELAPVVADRTDLKNPARVRRALERALHPAEPVEFALPEFRKFKIALDLPKEDLDLRIAARISKMVHNGWVQELEVLRNDGYLPEQPGFRAIGYRNFWRAMIGEIDLEDAIEVTIAETRRYAKRQRTWVRSEPSVDVLPLDPSAGDPIGDALRRMPLKL